MSVFCAEGTGQVKVLEERQTRTYQTIFELDNVAMSDSLEDGDLRLEVLEQLCRELAPDDRLDRYRCMCVLYNVHPHQMMQSALRSDLRL